MTGYVTAECTLYTGYVACKRAFCTRYVTSECTLYAGYIATKFTICGRYIAAECARSCFDISTTGYVDGFIQIIRICSITMEDITDITIITLYCSLRRIGSGETYHEAKGYGQNCLCCNATAALGLRIHSGEFRGYHVAVSRLTVHHFENLIHKYTSLLPRKGQILSL